MADEIKIWAIKGDASSATPVPSADQTDKEKWLEDALVANPEMLAPGLTLVGRQTAVASGALDLLGVDQDGRLVVFELKRGTLTREAVAQVVDYCSYLESLSDDELTKLIEKQSDKGAIDKIANFQERYGELSGGESLDALRPVRMVLVGLGVDDNASRMVSFLADRGIGISLLTFHGYQHNGETLLARQAPRTDVRTPSQPSLRPSRAERRRAVEELADSLGIIDLWKDAVESFSQLGFYSYSPLTDGLTFYMFALKLPGETLTYYSSHSLRFDLDGKLRITFFPAAVHLCSEKFEQQKEHIPFKHEKPPNASTTGKVADQWYCLLDSKGWETHKPALIALASDVCEAWKKARHNASDG